MAKRFKRLAVGRMRPAQACHRTPLCGGLLFFNCLLPPFRPTFLPPPHPLFFSSPRSLHLAAVVKLPPPCSLGRRCVCQEAVSKLEAKRHVVSGCFLQNKMSLGLFAACVKHQLPSTSPSPFEMINTLKITPQYNNKKRLMHSIYLFYNCLPHV